MLENETFEIFFAKSVKEEGEGVQKIAERYAVSDEMRLWMTPKQHSTLRLKF